MPSIKPLNKEEQSISPLHKYSLKLPEVLYPPLLLMLLCLQSSIITDPQKSSSKYSPFLLARWHRCFGSNVILLLLYLLLP